MKFPRRNAVEIFLVAYAIGCREGMPRFVLKTMVDKRKLEEKEKHENYGHYLILAHAINRETEYANWLTDVLEESNRKK